MVRTWHLQVLTRESIGLKIFEVGQKVLYTMPPEEEDLWQNNDEEEQKVCKQAIAPALVGCSVGWLVGC